MFFYRVVGVVLLLFGVAACEPERPVVCTDESRVCRFVVFHKSGKVFRYEPPTTASRCINRAMAYELIYGRVLNGACLQLD